MSQKTSLGLAIALIIICFIASFFFYTNFPVLVATHWNFNGEVDGYSSAAFAAFFFPIFILVIYLILSSLPLIDAKKDRHHEFGKVYSSLKLLIVFFLTFIYGIIGFKGIGYNIPVQVVVPIGLGFLFIILGNYLRKVKQNWFMGIRNPWTMRYEEVWDKTHSLSSKIFMFGGLLFILIAFVQSVFVLPLFITVLIFLIVVPNIYSYILYTRIVKK